MTQTTVLILCERIINVFQCLSKRLHRLWTNLSKYSIEEGLDVFEVLQLPEIRAGTSPSPPPEMKDHLGEWQIYDGETGQSGVIMECTLHLFSSEFRAEYSSDEQCGMIQVLAKKQIENAGRLLKRLRMLSASSPARTGKLMTLEDRLGRAKRTTEESLESISQAFEFKV